MASTEHNVIFILGVQKTGTSSLVGMLNCHPQVFLLYETQIYRSFVSKYGNQLLFRYPELRPLMRCTDDIGEPYRDFLQWLKDRFPETGYSCVGDKLVDLDAATLRRISAYPTIMAIRDVRSWLCKQQIIEYYRTDIDVITPAVEFVKHILSGFLYDRCFRVRLEDLVHRNHEVITGLSQFLGLDLTVHADEWWNKTQQWPDDNPKSAVQWFKGHASSRVKPVQMDTAYDLTRHSFWDALLPLFEKYYYSDGCHSESEVRGDLHELDRLRELAPLPLEKAYTRFSSRRLAPPVLERW